MIGIEDLKQRYPDVRDIKPYGFVVVVPGKEFDPDWEFQLEDQGYKVHLVELDRRPVALVSCVKKTTVEEGEKQVYAPPPPEPESRKHLMPMAPTADPPIAGRDSYLKAGNKLVSWTQSDLDRLKEEWSRARGSVDEKAEVLTKLFPGRTAAAIKQRYLKLLRPPKRSEKHGRGSNWSEEETEKLITLWNQGMQLSDIAAGLPNRTAKSIRPCIHRLQLAGKIEKRQVHPHRHKVVAKEVQNSDNVDNVPKVENVAKVEKVSMDSQTSPMAPSELKTLTEVLDSLVTVVDKLGCQAIMQALEIKEVKQPDFKIPFAIWNAYADAMLREDKENRDRFRLKVHKLLEAYQ